MKKKYLYKIFFKYLRNNKNGVEEICNLLLGWIGRHAVLLTFLALVNGPYYTIFSGNSSTAYVAQILEKNFHIPVKNYKKYKTVKNNFLAYI